MKKCWTMLRNSAGENEVRIDGEIGFDLLAWLNGDPMITGKSFRADLAQFAGQPVTVWINSIGGDMVEAAQIYTAIKEHRGKVTVKIDGEAISAASLIAMAGDEVLMSPLSMMMIHNVQTSVEGEKKDLQKAIAMLDEAKDTAINAYVLKTGLPREKIAAMMDKTTWMSPQEAIANGFADGMIGGEAIDANIMRGLLEGAQRVYNSLDKWNIGDIAAALKSAGKDNVNGISFGTSGGSNEPKPHNIAGAGKIYAVEFDGTLVENSYPLIGGMKDYVFTWARNVRSAGNTLILWTCRCGSLLDDAVAFCRNNGLEFDYVNANSAAAISVYGMDPRKVIADFYVDGNNMPLDELEIDDEPPDDSGAENGGAENSGSAAAMRMALEIEKIRYGG